MTKHEPSMLEELRRNLERLGMKAMAHHLDEALDQAVQLKQGYIGFLSGLVDKQILAEPPFHCGDPALAVTPTRR